MKTARPTIEVTSASDGWPAPWPSVAELADTLPARSWTLVGGLMTQLHTIDLGIDVVRVTDASEDQVDVLIADQPASRVSEKMRGREMMQIERGTEVQHRTVDALIEIVSGSTSTVSVPRPFGALILQPQLTLDILSSDPAPGSAPA